MSDDFEIVHQDSRYEVQVKVIEHRREVIVARDHRHTIQSVKHLDVRHAHTDVESIRFSHSDRARAIQRAIDHLNVIGEEQESKQ